MERPDLQTNREHSLGNSFYDRFNYEGFRNFVRIILGLMVGLIIYLIF